jgi:ABC-type lipoprotein release transport system permease subunit
MDLNFARDTTSGREGIELLQQLQKLDSTLPVIVTAWASVELGVAVLVLLTIAALACYLPARQVATIDPMLVLPTER